MTLNPNIILAGQSPDIIGNLSRGIQTGQQMAQARRQNALADLYRTQGAGIVAGEQGALNALAGLDPNAALNVQNQRLGMDATRLGMDSTRLGMDATRQEMQLRAEAAKQKAAEYVRGLSAEQRAQEAAQLENGLKGAAYFYSQGDRAGYENFLKGQGIDPAQVPFDQFPAQAAMYSGVLEVYKGFQPEQAGLDRYKVAGGTLFDLAAEGGPRAVAQGAMQEETVYGPDGKPIYSRGGPGTTAKFTESQSKDNVYVTRAEGALATLDPIAGELTSMSQRAAGLDPTGIVRGAVQTDAFQVAQQAGEEFLQAILRKDTGAAITTQEQELYGKTYLPQPGDGPAVLEAKRAARVRAVEAIRAGMNIDQITATERALIEAAARSGISGGGESSTPKRLRYNPETGALE